MRNALFNWKLSQAFCIGNSDASPPMLAAREPMLMSLVEQGYRNDDDGFECCFDLSVPLQIA